MKQNLQIAAIVLVASIMGGLVAGLVGGGNQSVLGSRDISAYGRTAPTNGGQWTAVDNIVTGDLWSTSSSTVEGTLSVGGDTTLRGGTLNVTTSNTATSTIIGGCWQFYATSTATAHRFLASTTPGLMVSEYGSCPNL